MLRAKEPGEEAYKAFREQLLECDPPNVELHDTKKKAKVKVKAYYNQSVVPKAERRLSAQINGSQRAEISR